jgi:hypothetical protein
VLALSVAACLGPPPVAADPTVSIAPPSLLIDPGEGATLQVRVDDSGDPISCFIVQIHFDPAVFAVTDVHEGALYDQSGLPTYPDWQLVAPDTLQMANCVLGSGTFVLGPGELVAFDIEGVAPGESPVELAFAQVRDVDRIPYGMTQTEDGEVVVWDPTGIGDPSRSAGVARCRLSVTPNPIMGWASIAIERADRTFGSTESQVLVDVYDVSGRRCATVPLVPGDARAVWDARAGNGQRLPAGIYFMSVRDDPQTAVRVLIID